MTDHDAGNTVADHVGDGTRLRHEAVDTENQSKTGHRHVAHGRERGCQHDKSRAGDTCGALAGEQQHSQKCELLHKRHLHVAGLRNKDGGHRQIDRRAVQVKGVARRNHQPNHRLCHACLFHLVHHARQDRFRRTCAKHNQEFFLDVHDVVQNGKTVPAADQAQHYKNEEQAGEIERPHEFGKRNERIETVFTDRKGHGTERTQRSHAHDHANDLEEHTRRFVDDFKNKRIASAHLVQRETEKQREEEHLQNLTLGKGAHDGRRNDVQQEIHRALHLAGLGIGFNRLAVQGSRINVHAHAGLHNVDNKKTHDQSDRRDNFKVKQSETARLAHLLHVFHAGNAGDDGTEDHRSNDHLDQLNEAVTKRLHHFADMRSEMTEQNADQNRANHLKVQHLVDRRLFICGCLSHRYEIFPC